ncbi:MAG TPA: Flp pilus assembly protein CpaB [Mycobacteriales bacterium]|nr:Flp pilus assembly protein CpaB [Mycobacteriales bacterium]
MGRRTVLLLSAVLVAALSTTAVFAYVRGVDDRAQRDLDPVEVLVAKDRIPAGTTASAAEAAGAFRLATLPRKAVPDGALSTVSPIATMVANSDIFPGEQILLAKFAVPGSLQSLPIPAGKIATSVQLGDPQRVAGFVRPGSEVAVFITVKPAAAGRAGAAIANATEDVTRLLLPRLTVLAVGPTTLVKPADEEQQNLEELPTAILTLAVDQLQAQKLIYATTKGELYFALLTKDSKVAPGPPVGIANLFS